MPIAAVRAMFGSYRVAVETVAIVAVLVAIRAVIWNIGITGMSTTPLASSIIGGGVFVMGLVVAGTLSDYRDAERAPTDIAASLYALLREAEAMNHVWGKPDLTVLRNRLIAVVTNLRSDINAGDTRDCQEAVEELSVSLLELEDSDVPANYIVRLRAEQASLRKATLRMYHIQREAFLPSAKAMITSLVLIILVMLMFRYRWTGGTGSPGFPGVLLRVPAADSQRDRQAVQGRQGTDRRRRESFLLTEFVVHARSAVTAGWLPKTSRCRLKRSSSGWSRSRRPKRRSSKKPPPRRPNRPRRRKKQRPTWSSASWRQTNPPPANADGAHPAAPQITGI